MSSKKDRGYRENLEKCYRIVLQSSAKGGISAVEAAEKFGMHRTTVHHYLNSLELTGRVENHHGLWQAKMDKQTEQTQQPIQPLESEIVIELPMPKNQWLNVALLEAHANLLEDSGLPSASETERIILEKFNETRIIRIKGKNVDDLDLEKLGNLIRQANAKSSLFNLKRLFKRLKMPQSNNLPSNVEKPQDTIANENKSSET